MILDSARVLTNNIEAKRSAESVAAPTPKRGRGARGGHRGGRGGYQNGSPRVPSNYVCAGPTHKGRY